MQHQPGIAAQKPRGVGAHRQIGVDALGGVTGDEIPGLRRQTSAIAWRNTLQFFVEKGS